jgi:predicted transcriptional regulator
LINLAKATDATTATSSIVVSFDSRWYELLQRGKIRAVIRKRGPKKVKPECIYVYLNSPISAVVARLPIREFEWRNNVDAQLCQKTTLNLKEIRAYTGGERFAVYYVGKPELAQPKVPLNELASKLGFVPPQSFFILSNSGKEQLDSLGKFGTPVVRTRR